MMTPHPNTVKIVAEMVQRETMQRLVADRHQRRSRRQLRSIGVTLLRYATSHLQTFRPIALARRLAVPRLALKHRKG